MRCEVCGQEIRGDPRHRVIEGAKMIVCGRCAYFGSSDWSPNEPGRQTRNVQQKTPYRTRRSEIEEAEELEPIENYGETIRKARQKKGLTIEDLSRSINEKESVIKKLEKEQFTPTPRLSEKIKHALDLEIMEKVGPISGTILSAPTRSPTLGDLIKIKQTEKEEESQEA